MDKIIQLFNSEKYYDKLEAAHEDFRSLSEDVLIEIIEVTINKNVEGYTLKDIEIETIDKNETVEKEIVSGDLTLWLQNHMEHTEQRGGFQYEINADGNSEEADYSKVEVVLISKDYK